MVAQKEGQIVLPLNEGVVEGIVDETSGGVVRVSNNTRLTKLKGTLSRRPLLTNLTSFTSDTVCGGIVPGGRESLVAYFKNEVGTKRIRSASIEGVRSSVTGLPGQNAFFPYQMIDAGALGGAQSYNTPATAFDSVDRQWFVSVRTTDPGLKKFGVFITVLQDGKCAVAAQKIIDLVTALPNGLVLWCGITRYGDRMTVWYAQDNGIYAVQVEIDPDGITPTVGAPVLIVNPSNPAFRHYADVVSDDANYAYILTRAPASLVNARVAKIDLASMTTISSYTVAGATSNNSFPLYLALCRRQTVTSEYVAYFVSDKNNYGNFGELAANTMTANWTDVATSEYGNCAVQAWSQQASNHFVFANDLSYTTVIIAAPNQVTFRVRVCGSGVSVDNATVHWYNLQSRGAYHNISGAEAYPYFPLFPQWSSFPNALPTASGFPFAIPSERVIDPSIEIFTPFLAANGSDVVMTTVARYAIDKLSPWATSQMSNSNSTACTRNGLLCSIYQEQRIDLSYIAQNGMMPRYVTIDLSPTSQPGYAIDDGSVATIACAYPSCWDGSETAELTFPHRPRVIVTSSGGTGGALTGTFYVTAVVTYRDAGGNVHRSSPAEPYPITLVAAAPQVYVTMPNTMHTGLLQEEFDITLYWTMNGGSIFYAQPSSVTDRGANGGMWRFDLNYAPVSTDVQLYSIGGANEELLPEAPPAAIDIKSIGGRFWLIDAENPYSVMPSKFKQSGISPEFNGNLRITGFDPQYGRLVAVCDLNGSPVFLAERGMWRINGYGPDNAGQGGTFGDPVLISNQGCRTRESVVQVPGVGVMFQAHDGKFVLLSGQVKRFEDFDSYSVGAPSIHLVENEVIYPLKDGTGFVVYNWVADAWVHWPIDANDAIPTATATIINDDVSTTYLYDITGQLNYINSNSVDISITTEGQMSVVRGWIAPESPQGDLAVREIWVHGLYSGAHGVTVRVAMDYNESIYVEKSWTSGELAGLLQDGLYTLGVNLHAKCARAVKVFITATHAVAVGESFRPLTLTVTYGASQGPMRRALRQGALK